MSDGLKALNALDPTRAEAELLRCCGSARWAREVAARRPFSSPAALLAAAAEVEEALGAADWLEAFAAHPRIGERSASPASETTEWSAREQAGVKGSSADVRGRLATLNDAYHERFGYIFIICATGLSGEEMLGRLRERLDHAPEDEIEIAAEQQRRITRLRLAKLIGGPLQ